MVYLNIYQILVNPKISHDKETKIFCNLYEVMDVSNYTYGGNHFTIHVSQMIMLLLFSY